MSKVRIGSCHVCDTLLAKLLDHLLLALAPDVFLLFLETRLEVAKQEGCEKGKQHDVPNDDQDQKVRNCHVATGCAVLPRCAYVHIGDNVPVLTDYNDENSHHGVKNVVEILSRSEQARSVSISFLNRGLAKDGVIIGIKEYNIGE